ncbi:MAG: hypothetical protein ACJ8E3_05855 [Sphingomicrobium sp.]
MRLIVLGLLAVSAPAMAQQAPAPAAPPACAPAEYHQLDFWVGRWDVYPTGKDQLVAHSLIEPVYGCGIRENWMPIGKPGGGSLSIYVPGEKHWEQFWIDSSGSRAFFTGGWNGTALVITGKWGGPLVRMSYSKNADGSVRQHGEQSTDEGKTWAPSFDFTYRPAKATKG